VTGRARVQWRLRSRSGRSTLLPVVRLPGRSPLAVLAAAGLAIVACGPSFQAVYEGDVRFEHCYALDQGPASPELKKECWRDWLRGYTYGQSRDRVEYAGMRFSELSLNATLPDEDRGGPRAHSMAVPVPTNAFAPPPGTAEHAVVEGTGTAATVPSSAPRVATTTTPASQGSQAPGAECAEGCAGYWKACHQTCKAGACEACDKAYKLCVPGCFQRK
jgi:hypothetical protein